MNKDGIRIIVFLDLANLVNAFYSIDRFLKQP
jgi:hypothetical protein